jgi:alpha-1,2-mannosyltransferase
LPFANLRTWLDSRTRWEKAAVVIWCAILLFVCVRVFISPESKTVYPIFSASGRFWWTSTDLYEPHRPTDVQDGYRYSPTFAILVTPFAWLPDELGGVAWRLFNVGALFGSLAWLLRTVLQPRQIQTPRSHAPAWERRRHGVPTPERGNESDNLLAWLLLLTIPLALQSVNNGQANLVVCAAMVGTVAAVKEKRWNLASVLMASAFICKLYPIALGMMLMLLYPRQLLCRMPIAAMASLGLPFLCQYPSYVFHQYEHWLVLLRADDRADLAFEQMYRDLWLLIRLCGLPVSRNIYMLAQVLAGAGIALLCWYRQRAGWSEQTLLTSALALATAWMMLLGPATESSSFVLLAPSLAWSVVEALQASAGRARTGMLWASCVLFAVAVLLGGFSTTVKIHALGVHSWASLLYFVYLLTESREPVTEASQRSESWRVAA